MKALWSVFMFILLAVIPAFAQSFVGLTDGGDDGTAPPVQIELIGPAPAMLNIAIDDGGFEDNDLDGFPFGIDCNDFDDEIYPGATEICDGKDNNCQGGIDEGLIFLPRYRDLDFDQYGNPDDVVVACRVLFGRVNDNTDCNDSDAQMFPGNPETCDGKDNDCDGSIDEGIGSTYYDDGDNDGYGDPNDSTLACNTPVGHVSNNTDCNDADAAMFPNNTETCDGKDNDCDGSTDEGLLSTYYDDGDNDGYGDSGDSAQACSAPNGHVSNSTDCNDNDASMFPNNSETCDGKDNDCDGSTDEGVLNTYYDDGDNDGYGDSGDSAQACSTPSGHVSNSTDCNDNDASMFPNNSETCDGKDNDCDGSTDEGVLNTYYDDGDNDGYGDSGDSAQACSTPSGHVSNSTDCNDNDASMFPNNSETCDGKDNDCDGSTDEGVLNTYYDDGDNDGYGDAGDSAQACSTPSGHVSNSTDCNDADASMHPNNSETCDGKDNDCDGSTDEGVQSTYYDDNDSDGHGDPNDSASACSAPSGHVSSSDDCNDNDGTVYGGASEVCDNKDNDCDGSTDEGVQTTYYDDNDDDGYGDPNDSTSACSAPSGHVSNNTDCNDNNGTAFPGGTETCDGADNDCDGSTDEGVQSTFYDDGDDDGYGDAGDSTLACTAPSGHVSDNSDCDDGNNTVYPGASEACDTLDNDCDGQVDEGIQGTWYRDNDGDNHGDASNPLDTCSPPGGYVASSDDCDDTDEDRYPGNTEICDNKDNDCDGTVDDNPVDISDFYIDDDNDGFGAAGSPIVQACSQPADHVTNNDDCDDTRSSVAPGEPETCNDLDDDCDGSVDEGIAVQTWYDDVDNDGYGGASSIQDCAEPSGWLATSDDCDDGDADQNPGASEVCNGADDDCDGSSDEGAIDAITYYEDADDDSFGGPSTTESCSQPDGYVTNTDDCDDTRAAAFPGATEQCNDLDEDCDGVADNNVNNSTFYLDNDNDGFGGVDTLIDCAPPAGYAEDGGDCDDTNADVNPGETEICNGLDDDCDQDVDGGATDAGTWYTDLDGDSRGNPTTAVEACTPPAGTVDNGDDCNDSEALAWFGNTESCDGVDNDCDGQTDPPTSVGVLTYYGDADGDGFGDPNHDLVACTEPPGTAAVALDCDDLNPAVNPDADEVCDTLDNDCDGTTDVDPLDPLTFYEDTDGDGYGVAEVLACSIQAGLAELDGDCDDSAATTNPGAYDQCDDLIDNNCDGSVDENDVDIEWFEDNDGDNVGTDADVIIACAQPAGYAATDGDCDDNDAGINPNALESCDSIDTDCDGNLDNDPVDGQIFYYDLDGDGFGDASAAVFACEQGAFQVDNAADCDDNQIEVAPFLPEICDGLDNDCNLVVDDNAIDGRLYYADQDGDGFGGGQALTFACTGPVGSSSSAGDCDDLDSSVNPNGFEVCGGGDEDCDGLVNDEDDSLDLGSAVEWFTDNDNDGYGAGMAIEQCLQPEGRVELDGDCNDSDASVSPEGIDLPGDGIDQDCDGIDPDPTLDSDADGLPDYIEEQLGSDPFNPDTDGDGVSDGEEVTDDLAQDTDGDGIPDLADDDDDGDGIPTAEEGMDDTDGDGLANYLDDDSDNDGVPDSLESTDDTDGDGMPDYLDAGTTDVILPPDGPESYGACNTGGAPWWLGLLVLPALASRRR